MSDASLLLREAAAKLKFPSPCGELRVSDLYEGVDSIGSVVVVVSVPLRGIEGV